MIIIGKIKTLVNWNNESTLMPIKVTNNTNVISFLLFESHLKCANSISKATGTKAVT